MNRMHHMDHIRCAWAAMALAAACLCPAPALAGEGPRYGAFQGSSYFSAHGYQETRLSAERWYVAYQGARETSPAWVEEAWAARSAQLCAAAQATYFVELRYPFEGVTTQDELPEPIAQAWDSGGMRTVRGVTYIPMFISSAPQVVTPSDAPSKMAAIRCVRALAELKDASRALPVDAALAAARSSGLIVGR